MTLEVLFLHAAHVKGAFKGPEGVALTSLPTVQSMSNEIDSVFLISFIYALLQSSQTSILTEHYNTISLQVPKNISH